MPLVKIDGRNICDWDTFYDVFVETLGFPRFCGRNMNAWIDCMTYLDDPEAGMTTVHGSQTDPVVLHIDNISDIPSEIYEALVECSAFVNWRRLEMGHSAILMLSYYRST
jgi:hypothetical protein